MKTKIIHTPETLEYIREHFTYCPETGVVIQVKKNKYDRNPVPREAGSIMTNEGYRMIWITVNKKRIGVFTHAVVYFLHNDKWPNEIVDHKNGNILDNRPCNLRETTFRGNHINRKTHRDGRLPGATKRSDGFWVAEFRLEKTRNYLGYYSSEKEAHDVYMSVYNSEDKVEKIKEIRSTLPFVKK